MRSIPLALALSLVFPAGAGLADPSATPIEPGRQSTAYLDAISGRGIEPDVTYYDPRGPEPELSAKVEQRTDETGEPSLSDRVVAGLVFGVLLLVVGVAVFSFGGARSVALGRSPSAARRPARAGPASAESASGTPLQIHQIEAIADRRDALIALGHRALERAAELNGLRIGRSWTARDALRRMPADWPHLDALRSIAGAAEIAHFGGREVSEECFKDHLAKAWPIFAEASS